MLIKFRPKRLRWLGVNFNRRRLNLVKNWKNFMQRVQVLGKRTQVIASHLVGASKIIKTIPTKRTVSKQVGLAKRVVKQEQMVKRPNGQQFSNTLGQAKPEFSGMEAALKGSDMVLAQEAELNGNSQKQNLFFGDRSASHQPTEKSINVHLDSSQSGSS